MSSILRAIPRILRARPGDGGWGERRNGGAVAAGEGEVGLGSDTGIPSRTVGHNALVGIRSTMGLTSRAGVVPLNNGADIAGPMARTVDDCVADSTSSPAKIDDS